MNTDTSAPTTKIPPGTSINITTPRLDGMTFTYRTNAVARTAVKWMSLTFVVLGAALFFGSRLGGDTTFVLLEVAGLILILLSTMEARSSIKAMARWPLIQERFEIYPRVISLVDATNYWTRIEIEGAEQVPQEISQWPGFDATTGIPVWIAVKDCASVKVVAALRAWDAARHVFENNLTVYRRENLTPESDSMSEATAGVFAAQATVRETGEALIMQLSKEMGDK